MPTLPVNDNGAVLYYEDTGAPTGSSTYTTVFLIHGFLFHGAIFRPAFPFAAQHNLRLVTINMREYPGSTPLTDSEFQRLLSKERENQSLALSEQGIEYANFIARFIEQEKPPAQMKVEGKMTGGISILAWSLSGEYLLSLLAHIPRLKADVNEILDRYLRVVSVYDSVALFYGVAPPPGLYLPISDPDIPNAEKLEVSRPWLMGYWTPFDDLDSITISSVQRANQYDMFQVTSDPKYKPTIDRMSPEQYELVTSLPAIVRTGSPFDIQAEVFVENLNRALFDIKGAWPGAKFVAFWSNMSPAYYPWSAKVLADKLAEPAAEGQQRREVEFVKLQDANHFLHWDDPERFVQILAQHV